MTVLSPGATIGILGGGQLGRMLAMAAARLGFDVHIFSPQADGPAERVAARATIAPYDDEAAVAAFAQACDVVTYEFENVPLIAAEVAARHAPLRPSLKALQTSQDRLVEKEFANRLGVETVLFAPVDAAGDAATAIRRTRAPAILKTRHQGYDGKGQAVLPGDLKDRPHLLVEAFEGFGGQPCILEAVATYQRELSIIAARSQFGDRAFYDMTVNRHENGMLVEARTPADVKPEVETRAMDIASAFLRELDYVGVIAIEFFEMAGGRLLMNEFAPRVHNTGHWTLDAAVCDQFEMHIRAIAGWPLGDARRVGDAVMTNLIGDEVLEAAEIARDPEAHLHVYGKRPLTPGRKTGHVTRITRT